MLETTHSRMYYEGTGLLTEYDYTFRIIAETDLVVKTRDTEDPDAEEETLVLNTDYTVDGVGQENGGQITLSEALGDGVAMVITRLRPMTQETDIKNQGAFYPEIHEDGFDHVVMLIQQLNASLTGAFRLPETVNPLSVSCVLPLPIPGTSIRWNSEGDGLESYTPSSGEGDVTVPEDEGIAVYVGDREFVSRSIAAGAGIAVTNGDGQAGNPTVSMSASAQQALLPTGAVIRFGSANVPSGFLACDGSAVSRATYAALFAVIGETYGAGDGSTTFNLPDCRARASIGYAASSPGAGLSQRLMGAKGGEERHLLIEEELPPHTHMVGYNEVFGTYGSDLFKEIAEGEVYDTTSVGGEISHENMPPFVVFMDIIKT